MQQQFITTNTLSHLLQMFSNSFLLTNCANSQQCTSVICKANAACHFNWHPWDEAFKIYSHIRNNHSGICCKSNCFTKNGIGLKHSQGISNRFIENVQLLSPRYIQYYGKIEGKFVCMSMKVSLYNSYGIN